MRSTKQVASSLAALALLGLLSAGAHAASPGGCTGAAVYNKGKFLGYQIPANDTMIGTWRGAAFNNTVVTPSTNASKPVTGINTMTVWSNGRFTGNGWSRNGKGPFKVENTEYGNVYCLANGRAYSIVNDSTLGQGRIDIVILNTARDTAFVKDAIPTSSPLNNQHEMTFLVKLPSTTNMTDVDRVLTDSVYY